MIQLQNLEKRRPRKRERLDEQVPNLEILDLLDIQVRWNWKGSWRTCPATDHPPELFHQGPAEVLVQGLVSETRSI